MAVQRDRIRTGVIVLLALAMAALLCVQGGIPVQATSTVEVASCPSGCTKPGGTVRVGSATDVAVNAEVVLEVYLENFQDLYGVEIEFSFDPTLLQVQDDKPGTVGTQIEPGNMPNPQHGFVVQNAADNQAGTIAYAVALLSPSPAASGSGVLARIRFKAIAAGTSTVDITRAVLVATDSCCLEIIVENGSVSTSAASGGSVTGRVRLQGRTNFSGATVSIGGEQATTAADGGFVVSGIAAGTYTISASMASYLGAEKSAVVITTGNTASVPEVTLLAGDIDNNCEINIFDLVALGSQYGTSPPGDPRADFNQDNQLNIFDLVLLAGNYGLTCPTEWQIQ